VPDEGASCVRIGGGDAASEGERNLGEQGREHQLCCEGEEGSSDPRVPRLGAELGVKVVGGQLAAVADIADRGTCADVLRRGEQIAANLAPVGDGVVRGRS